jgi:stearoyl-CoA desaturase (delta-9 desaturase)
MLCCASGAVEGSARWWCRDHRAHHRYTDTEKDPYSIKNGFFYAHMGWMLLKQDKNVIGKSDISDLDADPMLRVQHKYYFAFALFFGFLLPTLVCGIGWGDYAGGYFIAGVARLVFVHHATFCVNSLAHYVGDHTYADKPHATRPLPDGARSRSARAYHNVSPRLPPTTATLSSSFQYDPTKVADPHAWRSLASRTTCTASRPTRSARVASRWTPSVSPRRRRASTGAQRRISLPLMTREQVAAASTPRRRRAGAQLLVIDDIVYDVAEFAPKHPGGKIIQHLPGPRRHRGV